MKTLKEQHPNFIGNWEDLKAFLKVAHSPIRSPERSAALNEWVAYKTNRQISAMVEEEDKENSKRRIPLAHTKGGHMKAIRKKVVDLRGASLDEIVLGYVDLRGVIFDGASMRGVWMKGAVMEFASFQNVDFSSSDMRGGARFMKSNFNEANLSGANLEHADLSETSFKNCKFIGTNLKGSNLKNAILTSSDLTNANLTNCRIYGVAAWDLIKDGAIQKDLLIEPDGDIVSVDDLEIAQFVYMLLNNEKITSAISTIGKKGVLILGRFTKERKKVLDAIREELRNNYNLLPIVFDFERATEKDLTETIKILAGLRVEKKLLEYKVIDRVETVKIEDLPDDDDEDLKL